MTYSAVDFVSDQLRAAAPSGEWGAAGVNRAEELARILIRNGIVDLTKLRLARATMTYQKRPWIPAVTIEGLCLEYEGKRFGFLGTPDRADNGYLWIDGENEFFVPMLEGTSVAWSAAGHGNVAYHVQRAGHGFAIAPAWGSSSDLDDIRETALAVGALALTVVLPQAGINAAQTIGAAVMGTANAAAYPTLAGVIGQTALGTVFSGGDVERSIVGALRGAGIGSIGTAAGGVAADASGLAVIGKMTDSATRAFLSGGDVAQAVTFTALANSGALYDAAISNDIPASQGASMEIYDYEYATGDPVELPSGAFDPVDAPAISVVDFSPEISAAPANEALQPLPPFEAFEFTALPEFATLAPQDVPVSPPIRAENAPFDHQGLRNSINTISAAALATLSVMKAYRQINSPTVNTQSRAYNPATGAGSATLDTGVVQSRNSSGQIVNTRPRVGEPMATVTGNIVVNNGDGTYMLISPDGSQRRIAYGNASPESGGGFSLSDINPAFIVGGIGLAIAILRR